MKKTIEKFYPVLFWLIILVGLTIYLLKTVAFHFYYTEQSHLFIFDETYFASMIKEIGGLSNLLANFFLQFAPSFIFDAFIFAVLLTVIGILTATALQKITPQAHLLPFCLLPVLAFGILLTDSNWNYAGLTAFILMLIAINIGFLIHKDYYRLIYTLIASILLFWWGGSIAALFVACMFLKELLFNTKKSWLWLLPIILFIIVAASSVYWSISVSMKDTFSPDAFIYNAATKTSGVWYAWLSIFFLFLLAFLITRIKPGNIFRISSFVVQLVIVGVLVFYGEKHFMHRDAALYEQLDGFVRTEQWDKVINCYTQDGHENLLCNAYLNLALLKRGELADKLFNYPQHGIKSVYPEWDKTNISSTMLSEIYFTTGHIALAQRMAFETNENAEGIANPRMLKRLIQTNLIYGAWTVADKYISMLEKSLYYNNWAHTQRKFIKNPSAIDKDALLGPLRRCIVKEDFQSEQKGLDFDLKQIIRQNPQHKATIDMLGALYLLSKDRLAFLDMLKEFYKTTALPIIPKSYAEAIILFSRDGDATWDNFPVSAKIEKNFEFFLNELDIIQNNSSVIQNIKSDFGDTYWYYALFNNEQ